MEKSVVTTVVTLHASCGRVGRFPPTQSDSEGRSKGFHPAVFHVLLALEAAGKRSLAGLRQSGAGSRLMGLLQEDI